MKFFLTLLKFNPFVTKSQAFMYMKKILLALALLLVGASAHAQLNVTGGIKDEPVTVCTIRMYYSYLRWSDNLGYYITGETDNRFDSPLVFPLGKDAEGAIQTLNDIKELIENKVALTEVKQNGKNFTLILEKMIGKYYISIKEEGNAGDEIVEKIKKREEKMN